MPFLRAQRVTSVIQEYLNEVILREMEFDGALVTVTEVEVQKDLEYADIFVSVIPDNRGDDVLAKLNDSRQYLRHLLLKKINIKPMPMLRFILDKGTSRAAELEKTFMKIASLREVSRRDKKDDEDQEKD
ncbi:30S ribosome-binding factor RbfA [Patescibacteria group bacterium]|nr:30S ribosome-binding factor RbfA [Patescibacteria group bacterium]